MLVPCRFCGQTIDVPDNGGADYPELHCLCDEAKRFQLRLKQMERADAAIDMLFGWEGKTETAYGQTPLTQEKRLLIRQMSEKCVDGVCDAIQMKFDICTAKVKVNANGELLITRTESRSVTEKA